MVMRITGQEHPAGPESPVGIEDGDERFAAFLVRDLHPAGRDGLARTHGRTRGRKTETDEAGDKLVLGAEALQADGVQSVQVPSTPRISDAALGHQEILAGTKHRHAGGAQEDDVHHARAQDIVRRGVERIGAGPFGDAIQPCHIIV